MIRQNPPGLNILTAEANNCTLVTHNKKELERAEGLKIEDWY